jgi:hypothetical protein
VNHLLSLDPRLSEVFARAADEVEAGAVVDDTVLERSLVLEADCLGVEVVGEVGV